MRIKEIELQELSEKIGKWLFTSLYLTIKDNKIDGSFENNYITILIEEKDFQLKSTFEFTNNMFMGEINEYNNFILKPAINIKDKSLFGRIRRLINFLQEL